MEAEVSEILSGLYVGGLSSLKYLGALGITHVLSVLNFPLRKDPAALHLQLPLQDSPGANMLQYLPAAIKFLDGALGAAAAAGAAGAPNRAEGAAGSSAATSVEASGDSCGDGAAAAGGQSRVLVHCQAGVSRSPAVVAAWLMRSRGMSADEALELLRARRACVDPNEGFRAQLVLFGDMRCSLDASHPVYRMWCLEELATKWEEQGYVDPVAFGQLPDGPAGLSEAVAAQQTLYRCRKCRQLLATSAHVMPVEAALGHRVFRDRQNLRREQGTLAAGGSAGGGSGGSGGADGAESCLFVEPMQWMVGTITGVVSGKLHCPKCSARLGSFNWSGISNPSGAWVTPAFQLHLSKLDTVLPKPLEALANVRRPLLGPARAAVVPGAPGAAAGPAAGIATAVAAGVAAADAGAAAPPSLPPTLPASVRRMGLGREGAAEEDEEQLPEPQLQLDPDTPPAAPAPTPAPRAAADGFPSPATSQDRCTAAADQCTDQCTGAMRGQSHQGESPGGVTEPRDGDTRAEAPGAACRGGGGDGDGSYHKGCRTAWFTHLILDCDGVLVDSEAASCEALRRAILEVTGFDIPHTFPRDYIEVFGMDVRSCVAHYRERFRQEEDWEAPEVLAPRVQAAKEVHYKKLTEGGIPAFDGAERLIRRALDAGMQVGVASSGAPEKIAHNLSSSGLAPLIRPEAIVSASHVAAGKPAPDVYLAAMKATGCQDPRRALVVEDAVNGLKAARTAGMFTVGITNQLPAALLSPWSDLVVVHLDEVDPVGFVPEVSGPQPTVPSDAQAT